jgi:SAM-dependent methyltransferase
MPEANDTGGARRCPACGGGGRREAGEKNGFALLSCALCSTLYTASLPAEGGGEDYDAYYTDVNLSVPDFIARRLDEIVATFEPYRQTNRLLDVGCGAGSFLEAAARAGWRPHGVEVSRPAVEHVRRLGFEIFAGELESADHPDGHFDVVVASEVLEHVADPRAMLREIARVLRPGGLLWATTPHGRGVSARALGARWSAVSPPEHLHLFSVASIRRALREAGFRRAQVATHGTNPYEIVNGLRRRAAADVAGGAAEPGGGFDRVATSYQLNEFLSERPSRRAVKAALNGLLNLTRLGDSLKVRAEK